MTILTITASSIGGAILEGTSRADALAIKSLGLGWRWGRSITAWYLPTTMTELARRPRIRRTADKFRELGYDVEVIEEEVASAEERAEFRSDRVEARQERLEDRAAAHLDTSDAAGARAHQLADLVLFGQPILVGHHSEKRHRSHIAKVQGLASKSVEEWRIAQDLEGKAKASAALARRKAGAPATMRRIETKQTEVRKLKRSLAPCPTSGKPTKTMVEGTLTCPKCYLTVAVAEQKVQVHGCVTGVRADDVRAQIEVLEADITLDQEYLASLEASGVKVWGPADFKPGDLVRYWRHDAAKVVRVNPKTLSVESGYSWTDKVPYDQIRQKVSKADDREVQ